MPRLIWGFWISLWILNVKVLLILTVMPRVVWGFSSTMVNKWSQNYKNWAILVCFRRSISKIFLNHHEYAYWNVLELSSPKIVGFLKCTGMYWNLKYHNTGKIKLYWKMYWNVLEFLFQIWLATLYYYLLFCLEGEGHRFFWQ